MPSATDQARDLLVLDAAYSLRSIRLKRLEHSIVCRDLGGYFHHVWSVHPLVGADSTESADSAWGGPRSTPLAPRHTFVEGHVGLWPALAKLAPLNFVLAQLLLLIRLFKIARRHPIAAIRAGDPYYLGLLGLALARIRRVPLVIRINGNYDAIFERTGRPAFPRLFRSRRIEKIVEHFVLRRADFVTAGNRNNLEFAIANGARAERTAVIPYGNLVAPEHFVESEARELPRDAPAGPYCISIARLEPVKRVDDVIDAFAKLHHLRPTLQLLLIGDGSLREELARRAATLGVEDGVVFAGERDQEWIAAVLPGASAVIAVSAGRALVEAALSGRPIIAYDDDWHGELIRHGETGVLVPVGDIDALADGIAAVLEDTALADRLGSAARRAALREMDPVELDATERAVYEQLRS